MEPIVINCPACGVADEMEMGAQVFNSVSGPTTLEAECGRCGDSFQFEYNPNPSGDAPASGGGSGAQTKRRPPPTPVHSLLLPRQRQLVIAPALPLTCSAVTGTARVETKICPIRAKSHAKRAAATKMVITLPATKPSRPMANAVAARGVKIGVVRLPG